MPWYNLKTYLREAGDSRRLINEVAIEAADDRDAMGKAHERLQRLPPDHSLALTDASDTQIWTDDVATS